MPIKEMEGAAYPQKRRLLPLFAEEEVVDDRIGRGDGDRFAHAIRSCHMSTMKRDTSIPSYFKSI